MNTPEKLETIVYGGAFNPPTLAHEAILQACVEYARPRGAEVWLLPSGDRLDKVIPSPRETRMAYLATMMADVQLDGVRMDILTTELDRTMSVETYDTAVELAEQYPDREMTWVFGADSTQTMASWKQGEWLLKNLHKLVIERPGSEINPEAQYATPLQVVTPEVSSTEVRRRLAIGEPISGLVSPSVEELLVR